MLNGYFSGKVGGGGDSLVGLDKGKERSALPMQG